MGSVVFTGLIRGFERTGTKFHASTKGHNWLNKIAYGANGYGLGSLYYTRHIARRDESVETGSRRNSSHLSTLRKAMIMTNYARRRQRAQSLQNEYCFLLQALLWLLQLLNSCNS
jgi:hypothetical protein